jgi:hypothetical protein
LIADFKASQKPNGTAWVNSIIWHLEQKKMFGGKEFEVLADKSYYKAENLKKCVENGITPYVTKQIYSNGTGLFRYFGFM